ncbi:putative p44-22 outer membrane protein, silent [Anaplasma phagocytophilum str. ApNP]|uniref:Putative p44-22 outer membrane protein, silent n=1 Tax=Anaplasma phagocytophilum str. ApNP TaxID=1359153 RepID=A0A0F3NHX0_ANAPH|nr:putative p44-22 outer membrane protein, silent [Anaplasma phagocytophilum str. ApNP]
MTQKNSSSKYGQYAKETGGASSENTALCGGAAGASDSSSSGSEQALGEFIAKTLSGNESKNWPTSSGDTDTNRKPVTNDNVKAVAGDLTKLTTEEKTIVAGLLAKTIEGGEVVEIRAVSATSVMVNSSGYAESHHMM